MSGNRQQGERPGPPNAFVVMVLVSLAIHVALVAAVVVLAAPRFNGLEEEHFAISLQHPPIDFNSLPPLEGNREAGPAAIVPDEVIAEPEIEEPEPVKPEPEVKKPEPVREEPKKTEERSEPEVISTKSAKKPAEPEPEPEPEETAQQLRERLESSSGVYSAAERSGGGEVSHHVAVDDMVGDGAGGGAPDLFRNRLVALIGASWNAPRLQPGQVMEAIVEFTIYSPPVGEGAVNQNRSRARVESVVLVSSSGDSRFDNSALETIRRLRNLPPLPSYIKEERLRVSCRFYFIGE